MAASSRSLVRLLGGGGYLLPQQHYFGLNGLAFIAGVALVAAQSCGVLLTAANSAIISCGAVLLFGLPHGALDLELLQSGSRHRAVPAHVLLIAYLMLALATYGLWVVKPLLSLAVFVVISVIHFAEDWRACHVPLLANGLALATLTAPVYFHRPALDALFVTLSHRSCATILVDFLLLVAPIALMSGIVAVIDLFESDYKDTAVAASITLVVMVLLPPLIGFAIYFCLLHSPAQLRESVRTLLLGSDGGYSKRTLSAIVVAVTFAAIGLTALIFLALPRAAIAASIFRATFVALSVLTVPHMMMPPLERWARKTWQWPSLAKATGSL